MVVRVRACLLVKHQVATISPAPGGNNEAGKIFNMSSPINNVVLAMCSAFHVPKLCSVIGLGIWSQRIRSYNGESTPRSQPRAEEDRKQEDMGSSYQDN